MNDDEIRDITPETTVALLKACINGDQAGAAAIVGSVNPLALVFALAAYINLRGGGEFGSIEAWDEDLSRQLDEIARRRQNE